VEGFSMPNKRSDRLVLEANLDYWDPQRFPRLQRIIFDNTLDPEEAVERVKTREGAVDLVTGLRPLDTLRVAQSPFAKVVKSRKNLWSIFGFINMRKTNSPWHDVRLRQTVNFAINRDDLIRYVTKGNGMVIPTMVAVGSFAYNPDLAPYPFDPDKAQDLLRDAGYPTGLPITLIASEELTVQATVVSKMLEQVGFTVQRQILDPEAYNRKVLLSYLDQPSEDQTWDIALRATFDQYDFPLFQFYHQNALEGSWDWVSEQPELRQLYDQAVRTVDREQQRALIHQMEQHTRDQAYFLFLYNPIQLYAVNKEVAFVPYVNGVLKLAETPVTEQHWSVRKRKAATRE
jgi:peptide/nickel transport system substrate-binding protein